MRFTLDHLSISLARGIPLAIADSKGTSLRVLRGRIWSLRKTNPTTCFSTKDRPTR